MIFEIKFAKGETTEYKRKKLYLKVLEYMVRDHVSHPEIWKQAYIADRLISLRTKGTNGLIEFYDDRKKVKG